MPKTLKPISRIKTPSRTVRSKTMTETIERIIKKRHKTAGSTKDRQHSKHQGKYLRQFDKTAKNKEIAWGKHRTRHPNDLQAKEQIKKARSL